MGDWIDFRELRQKLDFSKVLEKYNVLLSGRGNQATGKCPLPNHSGDRKKQSFSANLEKGIFQCFSCKAGGNVLDFACLMDNRDPKNGSDLRKTALDLVEHFKISTGARTEPREPENRRVAKPKIETNTVINGPLDFALKDLDTNHPYFQHRRLNSEIISRFGLGYCSRGHFQGRIAIPLHSTEGMLVGYSGRAVDETQPKYLFPGQRTRNGIVHEFRKNLLLYNAHRIPKPKSDLIVVEGFASVWWLTQEGFGNVVALMGWSMSEEQEKLIRSLVSSDGTLILLMDGDKAGYAAREALMKRFSGVLRLIAPKLPQDTQPTDFCADELESLFEPNSQPSSQGRSPSKAEQICTLLNSFPCLRGFAIKPDSWNAEDFERRSLKFSSGEIAAAQFVLAVWNPKTNWQCGRFDLVEAASRFDDEHRAVIIGWLNAPWWP